jgi:hypothetical protein
MFTGLLSRTLLTVDKIKREIFNRTKIDRWFLVQIKEIVDFEEELAGAEDEISSVGGGSL